ncbi:MAG: divergent PAP2 family protein [Firmicutes bacterium]|nr:divergent PAP2 family protein [Bacillota bacterium]
MTDKNFLGIVHNEVLQTALLAWLVAQVLKTLLFWHQEGRFNAGRFVGSGGMPSSHSALVVALFTGVGLREGWTSTITAITLVFALIVMYDAAGVRRAAGKQARVLNKIVNELAANKPLREERLKELLGHTPFEVIVGAILGAAIAVWRLY